MFDILLASLDGKREKMEVTTAILPTSDGNRTVLSRHMEVFIEIVPGIAIFKRGGIINTYLVSNGFLHFVNDKAMLVVNTFENKD